MIEQEVEQLRAKLAALEAGEPIPEPVPEAPRERKATVVDYWFAEYERAHGHRDDAFTSKDAAILNRLAKQFLPSERFAWMIREFLGTQDEFTAQSGWATQQLAARARGLNHRWVKDIQEPALRREKADLERRIRDLADEPRVRSIVDRLSVVK